MTLRAIKDRFMANPWVYDTIRPLVIGGFDHDALARFCQIEETDRVFDLGCGTGQLLRYLHCQRYLGVDLDSSALERARRFSASHVRFLEGDRWDDACRELNPTVVLMIGLVHHVSDEVFQSMIHRLTNASKSLPRIVTFDTSYFRGQLLNNLLSSLDRGKYVRKPPDYEALFRKSGLRIDKREILPTRLRYVRYIGYHLGFGKGASEPSRGGVLTTDH